MQTNANLPRVKPERTGWRDGHLSDRHRKWGFGCPAQDIDFLLVEYSSNNPVALIEYKSEFAPEQYPTHPSYIALSRLGERAQLPFFVVRYAQDFSWWKIVPINSVAKMKVPERIEVNERLFVTWLWNLRGLEPPKEIFQFIEVAI